MLMACSWRSRRPGSVQRVCKECAGLCARLRVCRSLRMQGCERAGAETVLWAGAVGRPLACRSRDVPFLTASAPEKVVTGL